MDEQGKLTMFWKKKPKKTMAAPAPEPAPVRATLSDGLSRLDELSKQLGAPLPVHRVGTSLVDPDEQWSRNFAATSFAARCIGEGACDIPTFRRASPLREAAALHAFSLHKDRSVSIAKLAHQSLDLPQPKAEGPMGLRIGRKREVEAAKRKRR